MKGYRFYHPEPAALVELEAKLAAMDLSHVAAALSVKPATDVPRDSVFGDFYISSDLDGHDTGRLEIAFKHLAEVGATASVLFHRAPSEVEILVSIGKDQVANDCFQSLEDDLPALIILAATRLQEIANNLIP